MLDLHVLEQLKIFEWVNVPVANEPVFMQSHKFELLIKLSQKFEFFAFSLVLNHFGFVLVSRANEDLWLFDHQEDLREVQEVVLGREVLVLHAKVDWFIVVFSYYHILGFFK